MGYFSETNFPNDAEYKEMMARTLVILIDYRKNPEKYEREAVSRKETVEKVVANYVVGQICSGLQTVDVEDRIAKKLGYEDSETMYEELRKEDGQTSG